MVAPVSDPTGKLAADHHPVHWETGDDNIEETNYFMTSWTARISSRPWKLK